MALSAAQRRALAIAVELAAVAAKEISQKKQAPELGACCESSSGSFRLPRVVQSSTELLRVCRILVACVSITRSFVAEVENALFVVLVE